MMRGRCFQGDQTDPATPADQPPTPVTIPRRLAAWNRNTFIRRELCYRVTTVTGKKREEIRDTKCRLPCYSKLGSFDSTTTRISESKGFEGRSWSLRAATFLKW